MHLLSFGTARIEKIHENEVIGRATGFFYVQKDYAELEDSKKENGLISHTKDNNPNRLFFVTNRHVVKDTNNNPDKLRIWMHRIVTDVPFTFNEYYIDKNGLGNFTEYDYLDILLYNNTKKPLWKEHRVIKDVDVVVIEIDMEEFSEKGFFVYPFSALSFLPDIFTLYPGEDLVVIGYPFGYFDKKYGLPIFKNASLASSYGIPFDGHQYFLVDAGLKPGMSGSPVFTKPYNMRVDKNGKLLTSEGTPFYLVGILSSERSINIDGEDVEPGLHVIWYAKLIEDIIKSF
jgi:hypothetical protein